MAVVSLKPRSEAFAAIDGTERAGFKTAVLAGLSRERKTIPSRFFSDELGSKPFENIPRLAGSYPPPSQMRIFAPFVPCLGALVPSAPPHPQL